MEVVLKPEVVETVEEVQSRCGGLVVFAVRVGEVAGEAAGSEFILSMVEKLTTVNGLQNEI